MSKTTTEAAPEAADTAPETPDAKRQKAPPEDHAKRLVRHYLTSPEEAEAFGGYVANEILRQHGLFGLGIVQKLRNGLTLEKANATPTPNPLAALAGLLGAAANAGT